MKKIFHLFTCDDMYPSGGMNDYRGSFETLGCAQIAREASKSLYAHIAMVHDDGSLEILWTAKPVLRAPHEYTWKWEQV